MPATSLSPLPCSKGHLSATHRPHWASLAKSAFGAAVAVGALTAGQVQALVVNVGGQDWDVTSFQGTYSANFRKFNTPSNGGVMPWFGGLADAQLFAEAIGSQLGFSNYAYPGNSGVCNFSQYPTCGPYFATQGGYAVSVFGVVNLPVFSQYLNYTSDVREGASIPSSRDYFWAQAALVLPPTPTVPGPLPALGAAAAFGFSRKLRSRIKANKGFGTIATEE